MSNITKSIALHIYIVTSSMCGELTIAIIVLINIYSLKSRVNVILTNFSLKPWSNAPDFYQTKQTRLALNPRKPSKSLEQPRLSLLYQGDSNPYITFCHVYSFYKLRYDIRSLKDQRHEYSYIYQLLF